MIDEKLIAEKIKDTRLYMGLTQEEFGKILDVSKQSVCSWEKGRNLPDILSILKISKASGKYFSDLLDVETQNGKKQDIRMFLKENEKDLIHKLRSLPLKQQQAIETIIRSI